MGTLPMRFPNRAVDEAVHAVETLRLRAFQIDSRVEARELSDPVFDPLHRKLAELRAPLFIHPLGFSHGKRFGEFFMVNTVGQPLEETLAISHVIMGGVLERRPDLDIIIAHGGGFLPYYAGRFDHAWKSRPEMRKLCPQPPSAYLRRLWYDTCAFDPVLIARLIETVGAERSCSVRTIRSIWAPPIRSARSTKQASPQATATAFFTTMWPGSPHRPVNGECAPCAHPANDNNNERIGDRVQIEH